MKLTFSRDIVLLLSLGLLDSTQSVSTNNEKFCGSSWIDAANNCLVATPCQNGNSTVCGYGGRCWADIKCSETPVTSTPTEPPTTTTNETSSPTVSPTMKTTTSPSTPDDNCPPSYDPNAMYEAADEVSVQGTIYKCKPFPSSGWCDQQGYEPGSSLYWKDAWDVIGTCNGSTTRSPTMSPTKSPTMSPTASSTTDTTRSPTNSPTSTTPNPTLPSNPTSMPTNTPPTDSNDTAARLEAVLDTNKAAFDNDLFLYESPQSQWLPSTVYRYDGFLAGLRVMYEDGVANKKFYIGDSTPTGYEYGLVNIAAFLAQSMKETIRYDACDENSWDLYNNRYPLSNSCGQLSQSYQDYHCAPEEAHMECPVDPNMQITAVTNAKWWGAPAPLKCGPKSVYPFTGYWDHTYHCNNPWKNPPESCDQYEGQQAGGENNSAPFGNRNGRTDVEGCCWWGRGVIQTTGVCNFGKLNYYLGKRAHDENRPSRYPTIDFCKDPEAICANEEFKELKWIAGMFYWVESLQTYDKDGWNYMDKLHEFVDGGMIDMSFIDAVSGIVNRGCHNPPCGTGPLDGGPERKENFKSVLGVMGLH